MAGTLTISGLSTGEPAGQRTFGPLTIQGGTVVGETLEVQLSSGDNTFAVPPGSTVALIIGPTGGAATLKLRTNVNSGDTGLVINGAGLPAVYPFATTPTSLIVNASTAVSALTTIAFI